jgi:hypothetical protein
MHLGGKIFTTIKETIIHSTGDGGIIATYQAKDGTLHWWVNGKPFASIAAPKKD